MKNQRMKTNARSFGFSTIAAIVLMLATLICCFTVMASADVAELTITKDDLLFDGQPVADIYTKEYDGTTDVTVTLTDAAKDALPEGVTVTPSAVLNSKDVKDASVVTVSFAVSGKNASEYIAPRDLTVAAKVTPRVLAWKGNATASTTYKVGVTTYAGLKVTLPELDLTNAVENETVAVQGEYFVTVNGVTGAAPAEATVTAVLSDNYVAPAVTVNVDIQKIQIVSIDWDSSYEFVWGDAAAFAIKVFGYEADGTTAHEMVITYPADYGSVKEGGHLITATVPDAANMQLALNNTANAQANVLISKVTYTVGMEDISHVKNDGESKPAIFNIAVLGEIPADVRALIEYKCNGTAFAGSSDCGAYEVTATLPTSENYVFKNANGDEVTTLTATMYVNKQFVHAGSGDNADGYEVILVGQKGFAGDAKLTVSIPDDIARKAVRGFRYYNAYTVGVTGAADQAFTALIPIAENLYQNRCDDLTANDIYVYEAATGTMVRASEKSGYTVSLEGGYYRVEGVSGNTEVTFVIAPVYNAPFWLTAPGIALLILIVLAILALMFLIGMYLRKLRDTRENPVLVVDEGEVPPVEPVELEDNVDADAFLEETADEIADGIDVEAEAEEENTEGVEEAVAEAMDELVEDASAIVIEEEAEEASDVAEELADAKAEELEETVEAEEAEAEADEDALREAVEEALAENFNESADAEEAVEVATEEETVETFAPVETENEEDEEEEEEEEEGNFFGFGSMPLDFIDAIAEADKYAEMLEQERRGEVQLVTRYRRSFQSRLIQSQGNVQEYYNILKNALLSYKGVKNRISWNYEAFNRGRVHVAKMNAKTKTLYLYLALDPEELQDTKYGIVDVSSKKKYATVPVLMKIKGDRKFKYALELIEKLCGENLELPKLEIPEEDYRVPYQTTEELVQAGIIKKLVASVPVTVYGAESTEEAPVETTASAATEAQEVTFIEPTTAPAVEEAAEEVATEVPADAPASEDEPKEV